MSLLKSFAKRTFDFVLPGPSDGKNGALQSLVYGFEEHKRDRNLEALFEIYRRGSRTESIWSGLGTLGYEIVKHFRPRRVVELGTYEGFSACAMALACATSAKVAQSGPLTRGRAIRTPMLTIRTRSTRDFPISGRNSG